MAKEEAYKQSPTVRACVDRIAADAASVPLKIYRKRGDELVELPEQDEIVRVFATANPREGAKSLWQRHYRSLLAVGDAFLLTDYMGKKTPQELWSLRASAVSILTDKLGQITGYKYEPSPPGIRYEPREIYHARVPNPLDDWNGLSALETLSLAAALEVYTLKHWTSVMQNGGFVAGVIESEGQLSPEVKDQISKQWRENYSGFKNSGKTAFFEMGSKFVPIGLTPKDADFVNQWQQVKECICSGFGVPPAMIGMLRSGGLSDANVKEQSLVYWQNTVLPLLAMTESDLTEMVLPRFAPDLVAKYDVDEVPAMQEMMLDRASKLIALTGAPVLTRNEAREQLGEMEIVGGDTLFVPQALQVLGTVRPAAGVGGSRGGPVRQRKFIDTPERALKREKALQTLDNLERPALLDWKRALTEQEARILARMRSQKSRGKTLGLEDLWDDEFEREVLRGVVVKIMSRIVAARGQDAMEGVDPAGEFLLSDEAVTTWLEENALRESTLIGGRLADEIADLVIRGNEQGLSVVDLADAIHKLYEVERGRAMAIARTETGRAYNFATNQAWVQSGVVESKQWLTSGDEAVREEHAAADGQTVGVSESFEVGGEALEYPGDPAGSASNVINCRCVALPVVSERSFRVSARALSEFRLTNGRASREGVKVR